MLDTNRAILEALVDRYLEEKRALNWSPRTIESYRSHLRVFTRYLASETDVEAIAEVAPVVLRHYQAFLYHWTGGNGRSLHSGQFCRL